MAFQRKWSEEQERAVVAAQLDHGLSADQATKAANEGSLPGRGLGLGPFPIPVATVREYATQARREVRAKERAKQAPAEVLSGIVGEMAALIRKGIDRAEQRQKKGEDVALELTRLARAGQELAKLQGMLHSKPAPEKQPSNGHGDPEDFVRQLTEREARAGRSQNPT